MGIGIVPVWRDTEWIQMHVKILIECSAKCPTNESCWQLSSFNSSQIPSALPQASQNCLGPATSPATFFLRKVYGRHKAIWRCKVLESLSSTLQSPQVAIRNDSVLELFWFTLCLPCSGFSDNWTFPDFARPAHIKCHLKLSSYLWHACCLWVK